MECANLLAVEVCRGGEAGEPLALGLHPEAAPACRGGEAKAAGVSEEAGVERRRRAQGRHGGAGGDRRHFS